MDKVFLYLFTILGLAIAVPAQAMTCEEFNRLGPAAKNLKDVIAQRASHAQVDVYRSMIAHHAASIAVQTITPRALALRKLRNSKEGLASLIRESLGLTRETCFASPNLNFEDTGKGQFNNLLDASGKATAQVSKPKQQYYAVSKAMSPRTGRIIVYIALTDDKSFCESLLSGRREGTANPANPMTIESEQCATEISAHWLAAFDNKPIAGAYYVAYTNVDWPTRELFFDIDPSRPPEEVCRLLVSLYKPVRVDGKVRCVPPSRS